MYQTRFFTKAQSESPDGERLCVLAYRTYPFLGSRRQYEVFGPVWAPSYEQLRDYVLRTRPERVVTINHEIPGPHRYDRIQSWVETHGELFEPTYADYRFKVFRLRAAANP